MIRRFLYQLNPFRVTANSSRHLSREGSPGCLTQTEEFQQYANVFSVPWVPMQLKWKKINSSSFNVKFLI